MASVVFGRKRAVSQAIPKTVRAYSGRLPLRDAPEAVADQFLKVVENAVAPTEAVSVGGSPYRKVFRAGAVLFPRVFVLVNRVQSGRLGVSADSPLVESRRSSTEKMPWKEVGSIRGNIEVEYIRDMLLGESIVPFDVRYPFEVVLPINQKGDIYTVESADKLGFTHLANRLRSIEASWQEHGKGRYPFTEHINYMRQLTAQFPIKKLRVVYAASGTLPAACIVRDERAVIEHKLYWAPIATELEANFLCALLNSETTRSRAAHFQSRGQFGARDFDKVIFNLPIPLFDANNALHSELAKAGAHAEAVAATVEIPQGERFVAARQRVRRALIEDGISGDIEKLVEKLLRPA